MSNLKILFLLKKNNEYGTYIGRRSGLYNSAKLLAVRLEEKFGVKTHLENCVDGNEVDKFIHRFRPTICVIEALWVTPEKLAEVQKLHKRVLFIVRIHSELPFLAHEGMALDYITRYASIPHVIIAPNAEPTFEEFKELLPGHIAYLPNLYDDVQIKKFNPRKFTKELIHYNQEQAQVRTIAKDTINIGCFGAIRPMKNQLLQAAAALMFADRHGVKLRFHVNSGRLEQSGENVLKNLEALFLGTRHELVKHEWLNRGDFLYLVGQMDLGLQVSFNESFNIVAADFVSQGVPIIVSSAIRWMPKAHKVNPISSEQIVTKIGQVFKYRYMFSVLQTLALTTYNSQAFDEWSFLERV